LSSEPKGSFQATATSAPVGSGRRWASAAGPTAAGRGYIWISFRRFGL